VKGKAPIDEISLLKQTPSTKFARWWREHLLIDHLLVAACASFSSFWLIFFGAISDLLSHELFTRCSGATVDGSKDFDYAGRWRGGSRVRFS
jgi:hypothetical protein